MCVCVCMTVIHLYLVTYFRTLYTSDRLQRDAVSRNQQQRIQFSVASYRFKATGSSASNCNVCGWYFCDINRSQDVFIPSHRLGRVPQHTVTIKLDTYVHICMYVYKEYCLLLFDDTKRFYVLPKGNPTHDV